MEFIRMVVCLVFVYGAVELVAQRSGLVIDELTKELVPYVNIWIEGEDTGTSSDINGAFTIDELLPNQYLVFSAVGYESKRVSASEIEATISMLPIALSLDEVVFSVSKNPEEITIGGFNKSKINYYYSGNSKPKIVARYFGDLGYDHFNAQLKNIRLKTSSTVPNSRFHLRIYGVGADKQPDELLHDENMYGFAKKGSKITEIDVTKNQISIPEDGLFVAIEWLIVDENIYCDKGRDVETREKSKYCAYDPLVGIVVSETNPNSWIYANGQWTQCEKNPDYMGKKERGKYNMVAMELVVMK